jgi:hypothetical protein
MLVHEVKAAKEANASIEACDSYVASRPKQL